jgi:SNF2 family DNA or RNA helicase
VNADSHWRREGGGRVRFGPIGVAERPVSVADLALPSLVRVALPHRLYEFQHEGMEWLLERDQALLADDMGLGKTIQIACAIAELCSDKIGCRVMVVSPATLIDNWINELSTWAPLLVSRSLRGLSSNRRQQPNHVLVVSYDEVDREAFLRETEWDLVVADEAHHLRNGRSNRSRAFRNVCRKRLWLATGTPIENRPSDMAEVLSILAPTRFSSSRLGSNPDVIRSAAQEFTLRRTKESVLGEIPAITSHDVPVELHPEQLVAYRKVELGRDGISRHAFARMRELQRICDFVDLTSAKLDWIAHFCSRLPEDEKVIVFSSSVEVLVRGRARLSGSELISGETPHELRSVVVRRFQTDMRPRVLFLSQRVGAEGITLTRANHVVFINQWWNPSATSQGIDRIRRIGQHRKTHCYRLYAPGTIEDRVRQLLSQKTEEAEAVLGALSD